MPGRLVSLVNDEIYHVFNRGIAHLPTFLNTTDYERAFHTLIYYQNINPPIKYSTFIEQPAEDRTYVLNKLAKEKNISAEIICYCFMPNHFHLLLKQKQKNGISKFVGKFENSYTRYFNTKSERNGPIFQGRFKAVRIETDEQLLHVSRYIHLNPFTSSIVQKIEDLQKYIYSSYPEYLNIIHTNFFEKEPIVSHFNDINAYQIFIHNQANYQRELKRIRHLILEK
jgi:putative transposase